LVGVGGEVKKKLRSRSRKFAGRSTITSAGADQVAMQLQACQAVIIEDRR